MRYLAGNLKLNSQEDKQRLLGLCTTLFDREWSQSVDTTEPEWTIRQIFAPMLSTKEASRILRTQAVEDEQGVRSTFEIRHVYLVESKHLFIQPLTRFINKFTQVRDKTYAVVQTHLRVVSSHNLLQQVPRGIG